MVENFKSLQTDKLNNDPLQAEIRSPNVTPNLILSLNLVKWFLIWLAVKVIVKNNYPKTLLLPYTILAMELFVYVDTF